EFIPHITRLGSGIETIVVGLPLKMNATDSKTTEHARRFADTLKQLGNWPVELFDERLTTVQAERSLKEGSFSRKKRAQLVDSVSAVILLQNYLQIRGLQRC
ncbi:MAG: putative HoLLiday junction resolvase, partial [Chlamydiia bacterium]|nr:putative HoLLiday junction resolvase [Chlamydiia bacterium]